MKIVQTKKRSSKLGVQSGLHFPQSSALKIVQTKKHSSKLGVFLFELFIRDHEGIQTPDRWSRNPVLYSAELRGLFKKIDYRR